jgi:hypothetical protein
MAPPPLIDSYFDPDFSTIEDQAVNSRARAHGATHKTVNGLEESELQCARA